MTSHEVCNVLLSQPGEGVSILFHFALQFLNDCSCVGLCFFVSGHARIRAKAR